MVDSEDECDRRRGRDKFRRERNDYNDRNTNIRREDWSESSWSRAQPDRNQVRRDYRDNYNSASRMNYGRNDRYSPADRSGDLSPPSKRIRRDWDDRYSNYDAGGYHGSHHTGHFRDNWGHDNRDRDDEQPKMMTLKQFVNEQDDLDSEVLISKYNEYKNEFKRVQLQEFFNRHKDEEWFRCKYHPDEIEKRKIKVQQSYQHRLNVFMELFDAKYFENVSLDVDNGEQIVKVLDAAVIKLEGGTDFDLLALNSEIDEQKNKDSIFAVDSSFTTKASFASIKNNSNANATNSNINKSENDVANSQQQNEVGNSDEIKDTEESKPEDGESSSTPKAEVNEESGDSELIEEGEDASKDTSNQFQDKNEFIENEKKPRALHKTCSIFFRNLAPSITREEIEKHCKKFPGFLRLAISEPQIDRRFNRRGWATYERTVNIRDICWQFNSIKINETEVNAIVNRDLTRRIRSVNGISSHKTVVRADIRHVAKLIMKLDSQKKLWEDDSKTDEESKSKNGLVTRNPLLKNITDYLIEEAPAEEAELLGTTVEDALVSNELESTETNGNNTAPVEGTQLERDEELIKVLDRLLFYLRIVHSIDYYNHCEYPNEDEMPNRIGLIHARGLISSARVTPVEITEYIKYQEHKVQPLLKAIPEISLEEAKKLGLKNVDEAIEAFIKKNTKEENGGKWCCLLSQKRFVAPEFVRKHIYNKHMNCLEQVKAETNYFNNYILDPKRPQLPEHPLNRPGAQNQPQQHIIRHEPISGPTGYGYNQRGNHMSNMMGGSGGYVNHYSGYMPPPQSMVRHHQMEKSSRDAVDYDDVAFEELI